MACTMACTTTGRPPPPTCKLLGGTHYDVHPPQPAGRRAPHAVDAVKPAWASRREGWMLYGWQGGLRWAKMERWSPRSAHGRLLAAPASLVWHSRCQPSRSSDPDSSVGVSPQDHQTLTAPQSSCPLGPFGRSCDCNCCHHHKIHVRVSWQWLSIQKSAAV